jgi:hypothetical protein
MHYCYTQCTAVRCDDKQWWIGRYAHVHVCHELSACYIVTLICSVTIYIRVIISPCLRGLFVIFFPQKFHFHRDVLASLASGSSWC